MKVAIVAPLVSAIREPQRGGSQAFVSDLARGLVERGHEVHLYAASGSEVDGVQVIDTGVDHRALQATLYRAGGGADAHESGAAEQAFAAVYDAVRREAYDVVHNHAFDAPAVTLANRARAPVVHTLHLPPDAAVADALRHAARCDPRPTVAGVSAFQASAWRSVVPVEAILPPHVPTRLIRWSPTGGDRAVFAGRLSPEKGAAEAIEIALRGRRLHRCLRRQLRRRIHPGADRPATRRSGGLCSSRRSANESLGGDGRRGRRSLSRPMG